MPRYAYPHGQCRSVGVGGYLLGGGVNWLGTYNKYGYGAESVLQMRAVLADGAIADVTPEATQVERAISNVDFYTNVFNSIFWKIEIGLTAFKFPSSLKLGKYSLICIGKGV